MGLNPIWSTVLLATMVLGPLLVALAFYRWRRVERRDAWRIFIALLVLHAGFTVVLNSHRVDEAAELWLDYGVLAPMRFVQLALPVVIGVWFGLWSLRRPEVDTRYTDAALREAIPRILDSEEFLCTLRTALPKGQDDEEYGLDYIPFMLHNIDERRKRFSRSSSAFLALTLCLGVIFAAIVVYFGYVMVNFEGAGAPRFLAAIEKRLSHMEELQVVLRKGYFDRERFTEDVGPKLESLSGARSTAEAASIRREVNEAITEVHRTDNVAGLVAEFNKIQAKHQPRGRLDEDYVELLQEAAEAAERFLADAESVLPQLGASLRGLERLVFETRDEFHRNEIGQGETIRRFAIGLIVSSFFLALLRYTAGIYRNHYQQLIMAEREDSAVRRFYVAFRGADSGSPNRDAVLSDFAKGVLPTEAPPTEGLAKEELKMIREVLRTLAKKL